MSRLYNLARMHVATLGSVALIDLGNAVTGFLSFANAGVTDGVTVSYAINDPRGGGSEVGSGVYHSLGPSFTRTTVEKSSDGTSRISLSVNAEIIISPSAHDLNKIYGIPDATTDNALVRWDGTTGAFQDTGLLVDDSNNVTGPATLTLPNTGLHLLDTDASHDLILKPGSDLTADRTLTVTTGDANRTLDISAASVTVSTFGASLIDDADATTALATLGLAGGSTTETLTGTATDRIVTPDSLAALWEKGADVASSGTISLGEGGYFHITGTTTITDIDFATPKDGRKAILVFDGILTLTYNATTMVLPTGASITTAAGDCCMVAQDNSDNIRVVWYQRYSGAALVGSGSAGYDLIDVYDTGQFGELRTSISMGTVPGTLVPIYRIPLEVQLNDLIFATAEHEFTNLSANAYNYSVVHAIAVGTVSDFSSTFVYSSIPIGETQGDITGDQHLIVNPSGSVVCPYSGIVYAGLLAYAYSSSAAGGDVLTVEPGGGKLTVFQYRKVSNAFTANAVSFDGTNDWLALGAGLDGVADGKKITISVWVKKTGADAASGVIFSSATTAGGATKRLRLVIGNSNEFAIGAEDSGGTIRLLVSSTTNNIEQADGWVHFLFSCDLSDAAKRFMYINDSADTPTWTTYSNTDMDLTLGDWSVGAHPDATVKLGLDIAELWVSDEYIDISSSANRRRFITAGLKPAYMGPNGCLPGEPSIGNYRMPLMYFTGSTATWSTNRGVGGTFTTHGGLATAATSPS